MQKILGSHWKSSPKDWLLSLCLRPVADHGPYVAWQTQLISEHAATTLKHSVMHQLKLGLPTPRSIVMCCNLLVPVPKSFKRWGEWRMKTAKDECSWSSPKGTLPWPEGTNVMNCSCQRLLGRFQPCSWPRTTFQFNWPWTKQPIQPSSLPQGCAWFLGWAFPWSLPTALSLLRFWDGLQLAQPCPATLGTHHLLWWSPWDDFLDSITSSLTQEHNVRLYHLKLCRLTFWRWAPGKVTIIISGRNQNVIY